MRIVFLTQLIDDEHPALAQTADMVRALAGRCDEIVVVCDHVGRHDLPANVRFRTFGAGHRAGRAARFLWAVGAETLARPRPDAVLAHMVPLFLLLAAPPAKLRRVPLLLWYTHWHASRSLRLAVRLADAVASVDRRSFPLETPKLTATGHAIDPAAFRPRDGHLDDGVLRVLAVGRTARWKGYATLLEAARLAAGRGVDLTVEIRGPSLTDDERLHRAELERAIAGDALLSGRARIEEPVPRAHVPDLLAGADVLVSATQPDRREALDKAVLEAAACGVPVLSSNAALEPLLADLPLRLRFPARDAEALAGLLADLAAAEPAVRREAGAELRRRVVAGHSVDGWADQVVALVRRLGDRPAGGNRRRRA